MSRIRNIKPAFFKDTELYDAEHASGLPLRVAYAGLWTVADRAGRFKWNPRALKSDVLPYDDVDMALVLDALVKARKIFKYKSGGFDYGFIPNFQKHQFINRNEAQSTIPAPSENSNEQSRLTAESETSYEYKDTDILDTDGLTQTEAPKPAPSKPTRKITTTLPENFPDVGAQSAAASYWADRDRGDLSASDEAQQFRAHHLAHGTRMADWGQAWVTWYTRALKFNRKPANDKRKSAHDSQNAGTVLYLQSLAAGGSGQREEGGDSDSPDTAGKLLLAP